MLHLTRFVVYRLPEPFVLAYVPIAISLMTIAAGMFYWAVELGSIRLRDRYIPRRPVIKAKPKNDLPGSFTVAPERSQPA